MNTGVSKSSCSACEWLSKYSICGWLLLRPLLMLTKPSCSLARHWPVHRSQVGTGGEERATCKIKYLQSGGPISKLGRTGPKALPVVWLWSSLHNDIWIGTTSKLTRDSGAARMHNHYEGARCMMNYLVFQTSDMRNRCNSQWPVRSSRKLDRIKDTTENSTA